MILDAIKSPTDLKALSHTKLNELSTEIRELLINTVTVTGGHLASNLGVVELTIALHCAFNSPIDKIIWDVGHQCYTHKLLTGRKDTFHTLRQFQGLSGFPVRTESEHDAFGAGHAGTSVSAALGIALVRDIQKKNYNVVAIIGDGSLGNGMALEAINHAGHLGARIIVILNDNGMAISPSVGWVSHKSILNHTTTNNLNDSSQSAITDSARIFWQEMGFTYQGPVDGHNIAEMIAIFKKISHSEKKPVLIHLITKKGKGYLPAAQNALKFHDISASSANNSTNTFNKNTNLSYNQIFAKTLIRLMKDNPRITTISAAMLEGTGLVEVANYFPERVFDTGICEQHAVTLAAGMATQNFIPVVAIYSTFLQRAYDQIIHDICVQELPVVLAVDRAGIIGNDGKTHQGTLDLSYLRSVPNLVLSAPKDENELQHLLFTAIKMQKPFAIRYPRGTVEGVALDPYFIDLPIGKAEILKEGEDLAIIAIGATVHPAVSAAYELERKGIHCSVVNARFVKPLDTELLINLAKNTGRLLTIEENTITGGFGSAVCELIMREKLSSIRLECLALPDKFIEHGSQNHLRATYNLDKEGIVKHVATIFPEFQITYHEYDRNHTK